MASSSGRSAPKYDLLCSIFTAAQPARSAAIRELADFEGREPMKDWIKEKADIAKHYINAEEVLQDPSTSGEDKDGAREVLENLMSEMDEMYNDEIGFREQMVQGEELNNLEKRQMELARFLRAFPLLWGFSNALLHTGDPSHARSSPSVVHRELAGHLGEYRHFHIDFPTLTACLRRLYNAAIGPTVEPALRYRSTVEYQTLRRYSQHGQRIADTIRHIIRETFYLYQAGQTLPTGADEFMRGLPPTSDWSPHFISTRPAVQPPYPPRSPKATRRNRRRSTLGQFMERAEHSLGTHLSARQRAVYASAAARRTGRGW
ncbi:hypothetical protein JCM11251_002353 [Rhodosporidiobolus azoricus]